MSPTKYISFFKTFPLPASTFVSVDNGSVDGWHSKVLFSFEFTYKNKNLHNFCQTWWCQYMICNMYWRTKGKENCQKTNNNCAISNCFLHWGHMTSFRHGLKKNIFHFTKGRDWWYTVRRFYFATAVFALFLCEILIKFYTQWQF